ncbi:hypothetical protein [Actinomadura bangladeshensis]|uniref:Uncharacterized protein n=1 Tax=Actinomadura bangladeshensis TaxID=453573 RepID=A0A6L9QQC3_9ACTN|nr:hypothetical protein [Actinomadura bangladeshensis]NEA27328.1 hypothetical protein [Actinomadura bangladeshensis]
MTNPQAPDGPADNGRTPPPEAPQPTEAPKPAEAGESGTEQPAEAANGTPDHGTTGDAPPAPQEGEPTQPGTKTSEAAPGGTAPGSGTDERGNTDDPPPSSEETDQSAGAPGPPGEQDGDHGKKGPEDDSAQNPDETNRTNPKVPEPANESTPPDRDAPQSTENKNPGRELAPQEEAPVETEPSRFSGKVMITIDSDGRPVPPDREPVESEVGTRGRGEFGSPEDDPADRDPSKTDPERSSRRDELRRGVFERPNDVKKSVDTLSEPIKHGFERVPPTGQHEGFNKNIDQFRPPDHPMQAGSVVLTAASAVIVLTEAGRRGTGAVRQMIRKNHGDHR